MSIEVKNLKRVDPYAPLCGCDSYIEHWERAKGHKVNKCSGANCPRKATVGGHVLKCSDSSKNTWWIAPICTKHNAIPKDKCYKIKDGSIVSVAKKTACRKK